LPVEMRSHDDVAGHGKGPPVDEGRTGVSFCIRPGSERYVLDRSNIPVNGGEEGGKELHTVDSGLY
jgi:hypothetical protein